MANKLKQKRSGRRVESISPMEGIDRTESANGSPDRSNWWLGSSRHGKLLLMGIIALVGIGVLGSGLKYLEASAKDEIARRADNQGRLNNAEQSAWLNTINPFMPAPLPSPTPQLAKEYVYAGSRLLAVEDANANATPPADLAVWRPSSGMWYVMGSAGSQQTFQPWGQNGDVPVQGDFDGDGKTDFSIWRPSDGNWWVLFSSTGTSSSTVFQFGSQVDIATPADFDGDGKTDFSVFYQPTGYWHIWRSSTQSYQGQGLGSASNDTPIPADYDGDGKADVAIFNIGTADFNVLRSSDGQVQFQHLGQSGAKPVSADYDGDGRADFAVRQGADWVILYSSTNQIETITWKLASDIAVPNDYDGDGKVDIAVWRPSGPDIGKWFIRQSSLGGLERNAIWGELGDIPVPAFYRR